MNTQDDMPLPEDLKLLVARLKQFQPTPPCTTEAEMLFEAGRRSAMNAVRAEHVSPRSIVSRSFIGGTAVGLTTAACLFLCVQALRVSGLGLLSNPDEDYMPPLAGPGPHSLESVPAVDEDPVLRPTPAQDEMDSERIVTLAAADDFAVPIQLLNRASRRVWLMDTSRASNSILNERYSERDPALPSRPQDASGMRELYESLEEEWQ